MNVEELLKFDEESQRMSTFEEDWTRDSLSRKIELVTVKEDWTCSFNC